MKKKSDFTIPFAGLKLGHHLFDFQIDDSFFEDIEYSLIESGSLKVDIDLEKKETMLITHFRIQGIIEAECNLCTDPVNFNIENSYTLIYKFGLEELEDDSIIVIHPDSYQIDVKQPIYEFISISIPQRIVHEEGNCNPEMLESLKKYLSSNFEENKDDGDPIDPRWSALKNLN
ncbi:MAG: hypothetical protein RLZ10_278 [Bacteroidota bacterium]|jgi:uncharacterized metal-binding protein YceD (DUF177 family)